MRRLAWLLALIPAIAKAERPSGSCVAVGVDFTPTDALQIVAWVEKADGTFVDTIYVTNKIGRYGMGNRPGVAEYNTGNSLHDTWPYGRREQTFPVWAHRHGLTFSLVIPQDGNDKTLSHAVTQSSAETNPPYCRPYLIGETNWEIYDAGSCASQAFSDKGTFATDGRTSLYPPRSDVVRQQYDSASVDQFRDNNPFDAVSKPTPVGGAGASVAWAAPSAVDFGDYVLFVETAKTYDVNATYNLPAPTGLAYGDYGRPWRGQPSVVYRVPFSIATADTLASADSYVGYGDVDGATGTLHPPDATITIDTPGSGASRLQLVSDAGALYRLRVRSHPEIDPVGPDALGAPVVVAATTSASILLTASGDDGMTGTLAGYEVRVRADSPMTSENFASSSTAIATYTVVAPGETQTIEVTGLLPETEYSVGIRPLDNCYNRGPLAIATFKTGVRGVAEVPWCFVATAAYGSAMANDVQMLRRFRDAVLTSNVLGELAVETYYTFGPALAGTIGESELLRGTARAALQPFVAWVRRLAY